MNTHPIMQDPTCSVSVVVPVLNEEANIEALFQRVHRVFETLDRSFELIFVDDGSQDTTPTLLNQLFEAYPDVVRVIRLSRNYGQHMAIMAGLEHASGEYVMTIDADLQNPPEEIPKILDLVDQGHDYVGSYRLGRQDNWFRTYVSKLVNLVRGWVTHVEMRDHGCMLRAYSRSIIQEVVASPEVSTLVPVLAYTFSSNPAEVGIRHAEREKDQSKYNLYKLIRLNFDLFTSNSLFPLQAFTMLGMAVSCLSSLLVIYLFGRRLIVGPEAEGVFTLFAILFFLVSVVMVGIGLLGEYLGRLYELSRRRPRYRIFEVKGMSGLDNQPHVKKDISGG